MRRQLCAFLFAAFFAICASQAGAAESLNSGVPATSRTYGQSISAIVPDAANGSFLAWVDNRLGASSVWIQHVDSVGTATWGEDGLPAATFMGAQSTPVAVTDGAGGLIVVWTDERSSFTDIYAQRFTPTGQPLWPSGGVRVVPTQDPKVLGGVIADGAGGLCVAMTGVNSSVVLQRLTSSGSRSWSTSGSVVGTGSSPALLRTASDFFAVAWKNAQGTGTAQLVNGLGQLQWNAQGIAFGANRQITVSPIALASDGQDGFVAAFANGDQFGTPGSVFAAHVNSFGVADWTTSELEEYNGTIRTPKLVRMPDGTFIAAWGSSNGNTRTVALRKLSPQGQPVGTQTYLAIAFYWGGPWPGNHVEPSASLALMNDTTLACAFEFQGEVRLQRIKTAGAFLDGPNGVLMSTRPTSEQSPRCISANGGLIVAWDDLRFGSSAVFFQRIDANGLRRCVDPSFPRITRVSDVPQDQGGLVRISWQASMDDLRGLPGSFKGYDIYRASTAVAAFGRDDHGNSSLRAVHVNASGQPFYWERVAQVDAVHTEGYAINVATLSDSTPTSSGREYFLVRAVSTPRSNGESEWWSSSVDSGASIDNIAPPAPSAFVGTYSNGATALSWGASSAPDLSGYLVSRSSAPTFSEATSFVVYSGLSTQFHNLAGAPNYYFVRAVDIHGNLGQPALAQVSGVADIDTDSGPRIYYLASPSPNPVRTSAQFSFSLPGQAAVVVELRDVQGRLVRELARGTFPAGSHTLPVSVGSQRGRLNSGVYFLRMSSDFGELVRRVVIVSNQSR